MIQYFVSQNYNINELLKLIFFRFLDTKMFFIRFSFYRLSILQFNLQITNKKQNNDIVKKNKLLDYYVQNRIGIKIITYLNLESKSREKINF